MSKILYTDSAGKQFQKIYGQSHYALAGLVPVGLLSDSTSIPGKIADYGLALALPVHTHVGMSYGTCIPRHYLSFHNPCGIFVGFLTPFLSPLLASTVVSDYVPKLLQVPVRVGVLGMSSVMFLGLLKLNMTGPGVIGAVKHLWKRE
jgi:succinate dehydrogenase (ubiquinone) membrane anchor subunit